MRNRMTFTHLSRRAASTFGIAIVALLSLSANIARAQDVVFSVYQYQGPLGVLPGADAATSETAAVEAAVASDDSATTAGESVSDSADIMEEEIPAEDVATSASVEDWNLMEAIVGSAALREALTSPIGDSEAWEVKKSSPVASKSSQGNGDSRGGVIIAIDDKMQIKQLKPDLTDSIITAMTELQAANREMQSAHEESQEVEMDATRATLLALRQELNSANPSAVAIAELLDNLRDLKADAPEADPSD